MITKEDSSLQEWEILSDSDEEANPFGFEDIIHSDYFDLNSSKLHHAAPLPSKQTPKNETDSSEEILMDNPRHAADQNETASKGIEPKSGIFDPNHELGVGETNKASSFLVEDSKVEMGFQGIVKGEPFREGDSKMDLGFERTDPAELDIQKTQEGCASDQNSDGPSDGQELSSGSSSAKMSNSGIISVGGGEKKVLAWWKLPLDILKLWASRMRTVWSIPVAAAFIGILMVGRRLYTMKHKSKRIPLKISYEDKKAASQLLLRAAQLNEVVVRRVPIIRSQLLPPGGVTPWPAVGQL